jgi:hypothetical protein
MTLNNPADTLANAYINAFKTAYPQKSVSVRRTRAGYRVIIDGAAGDLILDAADMAAGIMGFRAHGAPPVKLGKFPLGSFAKFN